MSRTRKTPLFVASLLAALLIAAGCFGSSGGSSSGHNTSTGTNTGTNTGTDTSTNTGNTGTTGTSTSAANTPAIGTIGYSKDRLCEVQYTASGWVYFDIPGGLSYCYRRIGATLYDAYARVSLQLSDWDYSRVRPLFRRDFSDGNGGLQYDTIVYLVYGDSVWRRSPMTGQSYTEVLYNGQWMPERDYEAAVKQAAANASAASQAALDAKLAHGRQQAADFAARSAEMGKIFVTPACDPSYYYCYRPGD